MWLLLGLLGSVTALSASDLFAGSASDQTDPDEDDTVTPAAGPGPVASDGISLSNDFPDAPQSGTGPDIAMPAPATQDPGLGLFDNLGERIHSSDTLPAPAPQTPASLDGTNASDSLHGTSVGDMLLGHAGDDRLTGLAGDDSLLGGSGDDSLIGGEGDDTLDGGAGNDTLLGGIGADLLLSGTGANTLMAGEGDDTLIGQAGASFLNGGGGNDLLLGGAGNQLHGGSGQDIFGLGAMPDTPLAPVHLLDFVSGEDVIQIAYDPALGDPDLSITHAPEDPDMAEIRLAGHVLATIANAPTLTLDDIDLIAQPPT